MAAAARVHAAERGLDTRRYALVATGGAGPLHACGVARRLGLDTVVIPPLAGRGLGIRAAAGAALLRHHPQLRGTARPDRVLDPGRAPERAGTGGPGTGRCRRGDGGGDHRAALRGHALRGTGLRDPGGGAAGHSGLRPAGRRAAKLRAGLHGVLRPALRRRAAGGGELAGLGGGAASRPAAGVGAHGDRAIPRPVRQRVRPRSRGAVPMRCSTGTGGFVPTPVYQRHLLAADFSALGPAIIEEAESTTVVRPGWSVAVGTGGCLLLRAVSAPGGAS